MAAKSKRAAPKARAVDKSASPKVNKTDNNKNEIEQSASDTKTSAKSAPNGKGAGKKAPAVKAVTSQTVPSTSDNGVLFEVKKTDDNKNEIEQSASDTKTSAKSAPNGKGAGKKAPAVKAVTSGNGVSLEVNKTDNNKNEIEQSASDTKTSAKSAPNGKGAGRKAPAVKAVTSQNSQTGPSTSDNGVSLEDKKASKRKAETSAKDVSKKTDKEPARKKQKISVPLAGGDEEGFVLVVGSGETGQLGLGPDIMDRKRPAKVQLPAFCVQVCAGGMHTVCLTGAGEVYTFGCNDEGALGRITPDDDECTQPARVEGLPDKIVQVSAGDSHTAALSENGKVYIWGVFRDANGPLGMFTGPSKLETPKEINLLPSKVSKIASGTDHLACLTVDGDIYTLGCGEQGQLGRVAECFTVRGGRRGIDLLLKPALVHFPRKNLKMCDIWTGQYGTYAKSSDGAVYAWGLNNYYQLGFSDIGTKFNPVKSSSFEIGKDWVSISGGQHHTLAIDGAGLVYSLGRKDYGRLGLGDEADLQDKAVPTLIPGLQSTRCSGIACGTAVSYAIGENGDVYSWGMGSGQQLGHGDDDDDVHEPKVIEGKQLEDKRAVMVTAGGQHMVLIAQDRS